MASTTLSIEQFQQDVAAAQEAAHQGPVFITEDGEPRSVLIDIADYRQLRPSRIEPLPPAPPLPQGFNMADALAVPDDEYFEWEPEPLKGPLFHPVDFS